MEDDPLATSVVDQFTAPAALKRSHVHDAGLSDATVREHATLAGQTYEDESRRQQPSLDPSQGRQQVEQQVFQKARQHFLSEQADYWKAQPPEPSEQYPQRLAAQLPGIREGLAVRGLQENRRLANAFSSGQMTQEDYSNVGYQLARQERESKRGTGQKIADILGSAPAEITEWIASGGSAPAAAGLKGALSTGLRTIGQQAAFAPARIAAGAVPALTPQPQQGPQGVQFSQPDSVAGALVKSAVRDTLGRGFYGAAGGPHVEAASSFAGAVGQGLFNTGKLLAAGELSEDTAKALRSAPQGGPINRLITAKTDEERNAALQDVLAAGASFGLFEALGNVGTTAAERAASGLKVDQAAAGKTTLETVLQEAAKQEQGATNVRPRVQQAQQPGTEPPAPSGLGPAPHPRPEDQGIPAHEASTGAQAPGEPPPADEATPSRRPGNTQQAGVAPQEGYVLTEAGWLPREVAGRFAGLLPGTEGAANRPAPAAASEPPAAGGAGRSEPTAAQGLPPGAGDVLTEGQRQLQEEQAQRQAEARSRGLKQQPLDIPGVSDDAMHDLAEAMFGAKGKKWSRAKTIQELYNLDQGKTLEGIRRAAAVPVEEPTPPPPVGEPAPTEAEQQQGALAGGQPNASEAEQRQTEPWDIALANERIDAERERTKRAPLMKEAAQADPEIWQKAMERLQADPEAGLKLAKDINENPRPATSVENAMLERERISLRNQYEKATRDLNDAFNSQMRGYRGTPKTAFEFQEIENRWKSLGEQIDTVDKAANLSGSETGRAFRLRRLLANEDYEITGLLRRAQAAKGAEPLTNAERQKITELSDRIKALEGELEKAKAGYTGQGFQSPEYKATQTAEVSSNAAKAEWQHLVGTLERQKQPLANKLIDFWLRLRRAMVLSGPQTIAKITAAAGTRAGLTTAEEAVGSFWRQIPGIDKIAARAPREGRGLNVRAERESYISMFGNGFTEAMNTLKNWRAGKGGQSSLDLFYNPRAGDSGILELPGVLHAALKQPVKSAEFTRSMIQRMDAAAAKGDDFTSLGALTRMGAEAYKDAQRAIFMGDNKIVNAYNAGIRTLEQSNSTPAKALAVAIKTLLPIVKVPSNVVGEALEFGTGLPVGLAKAGKALIDGVEGLKPEQADTIMRQLKKGSLGATALALGIYLPKVVGGFYQPGEKRKEGEVPVGGLRVGKENIPHVLLHHPFFETMQVGATIKRALDAEYKKRGKGDVPDAVITGLTGLAEEAPFGREPIEISKFMNPRERGYAFGEFAKGLVIPRLLDWLAGRTDTRPGTSIWNVPGTGETRQRKLGGSLSDLPQHIESGIPGLRQRLPLGKKERLQPTGRP